MRIGSGGKETGDIPSLKLIAKAIAKALENLPSPPKKKQLVSQSCLFSEVYKFAVSFRAF